METFINWTAPLRIVVLKLGPQAANQAGQWDQHVWEPLDENIPASQKGSNIIKWYFPYELDEMRSAGEHL